MSKWTRRVALAGWLLAAVLGSEPARAQSGTTTVQDTVTDASGNPAAGTIVVSWGAFTTATGMTVAAGSLSTTLGAGGALNVALLPNAGATPMGSYYTAVYHLSDGTTSREFWVVPALTSGAAKLAGIRNQVLPTAMAMQTVSKQYVDTTVAKAMAGTAPSGNLPYVLRAGDTMLGTLTLSADPSQPLQAADKHYVDAAVTGSAGGDLSGSYPNPTVAAVHATAGTLDGVTIGASTPEPAQFTSAKFANGSDPVMLTPGVGNGGGADTLTLTNSNAGNQMALRVFGSFYSGISFGTASNYATLAYAGDGIGNYINGTELQKSNLSGYRLDVPLDVRSSVANTFCGSGVLLCVNETLFTVDSNGQAAAVSFHETLATPASSSASCTAGDFADDANFHYVCVAAATWKRVALSSF